MKVYINAVTTAVTRNTLSPRLQFLNIISHRRPSGLFGEMVYSRANVGNVQDEPGTSCCPRHEGSCQVQLELCQKRPRNQPEQTLTDQ